LAERQAVHLLERGLLVTLERRLRDRTTRAPLAVSVVARPGADAYTGNEGREPRRAEGREAPPGSSASAIYWLCV
jgi:hypothetical protein